VARSNVKSGRALYSVVSSLDLETLLIEIAGSYIRQRSTDDV
jgi:hypothetical protein